MASDKPIPPLDTARHTKYLQRCLRLLPSPYTANDSSRLALAFFGLAGLDLLSPSPSSTESSLPITPTERATHRAWVLSHQHPGGGFAGSPAHLLPAALRAHEGWTRDGDDKRGAWEMGSPGAANIAATSFALKLLALLAEPSHPSGAFGGVDRVRTLRWLRRLQRGDGSFGEVLERVVDRALTDADQVEADKDGKKTKSESEDTRSGTEKQDEKEGRRNGETLLIAGGRDMRYCYLAATVRWMLRGDVQRGEEGWVEDIDVDALVAHIRRSQTYDGGVAETARNEAHAGYAYCAAASLALLDRPLTCTSTSPSPSEPDDNPPSSGSAGHRSHAVESGISHIPALVHFLASRQYSFHEDKERQEAQTSDNCYAPPSLSALTLDDDPLLFAGYNGRTNKVADTCYAWWVAGALAILAPHLASSSPPPAPPPPPPNPTASEPPASGATAPTAATLLSADATRSFLLQKTQHAIGGFGKHAGDPPDIYHAFLGLAALSILQPAASSATSSSPSSPSQKPHPPSPDNPASSSGSGSTLGLKPLDAALVMSADAVRTIEAARAELVGRARARGQWAGELLRLGLQLGPDGKRPAWLGVKS